MPHQPKPMATPPQSRRCHLPNNQIVNDHTAGTRRAAGRSPLNTAFRTAPASVWAGTKNENARVVRSWFAPSFRRSPRFPLAYGEAAEYRAKPAGSSTRGQNSRVESEFPAAVLRYSATFLLRKLNIRVLSRATRGGKEFPTPSVNRLLTMTCR
jgi:hypothetical protein